MAEVLITLGIIGIVAALVMPGVINDFRRKELESRFKKTDSLIQQALQKTMTELDMNNGFLDLALQVNHTDKEQISETDIENIANVYNEFNSVFEKQFVNAKKILRARPPHPQTSCYYSDAKGYTYSFWGDLSPCRTFACCYMEKGDYGLSLPDGSFILNLSYENWGANWHYIMPKILFDTNGPNKGPNREGYDIFLYSLNILGKGYTNCDPFQQFTRNLTGCYQYARINQHPYDSSISYWEGLYRPKSWWENLKK